MEDQTVKLVPDVDHDASIKKQRLVYDRTGGFIFDHIFSTGIFILFSGMLLYGGFEEWINENNRVFLPISILAATWLIISLVYVNKLVAVKGKGMLRNKEDAMNTLKHFYSYMTFDASEKDIIRDVKPIKWGADGRVVTVILDNDLVYFHKASLMKGDSISPIAGLTNYLKAKEMAEYFVELQARSNV